MSLQFNLHRFVDENLGFASHLLFASGLGGWAATLATMRLKLNERAVVWAEQELREVTAARDAASDDVRHLAGPLPGADNDTDFAA